ncbi:hypothetical protein EBI_25651 [Enterocytozoon bieneusi H348]|nr:hypothetical protein EBI_25651 [Enterocytozoon bieneusi H348]|eukprot:XP_002650692.1 hypothetical protein EBI_25651 [Enterocytozoon bieneusi H348]
MFLQTYEYVEKFCKINDKYIIGELRKFWKILGFTKKKGLLDNFTSKKHKKTRFLIPSFEKIPKTFLKKIF